MEDAFHSRVLVYSNTASNPEIASVLISVIFWICKVFKFALIVEVNGSCLGVQ